jgi:hypothetical protein
MSTFLMGCKVSHHQRDLRHMWRRPRRKGF